MKAIATALSLLAIPIGMYLQHSILVAINADRLLMFLFWINLPVYVAINILSFLVSQAKK